MSQPLQDSGLVPRDSLITITHVVYGLHAFSVLTGLTSSAFVVTAFLTGWPSIIAVILNYVMRGEARGTYLASHFRWQIRTFWYTLLWLILAGVLAFTVVLLPLTFVMLGLTGLWVLYRILRGWMALTERRPMPLPV